MAFADRFHRRRRKQPLCERVFSHTRARRRKKLKQTSLAEQVEVGGVYMMRIVKAIAGFSQTGPTIFNACQSFFVKCDGTLRQLASSKDPRMIVRNDHEG